jgi:hypothetical protein
VIGEPLHYCSYSSNHLNMMNIGESNSEKRIQSSVKLGIDSHGSWCSATLPKRAKSTLKVIQHHRSNLSERSKWSQGLWLYAWSGVPMANKLSQVYFSPFVAGVFGMIDQRVGSEHDWIWKAPVR